MSLQTELTRITNAKAAIKTAIEGKGVTVPDATLLDGMAALIESIEAGGATLNVGTFTVNEDTRSYALDFPVGTPAPKIAMCFNLGDGSSNSLLPDTDNSFVGIVFSDIFAIDTSQSKNYGVSVYRATGSKLNAYWHAYGTSYYNNSFFRWDPSGKKSFGSDGNNYYFRPGNTYIYILVME